MIKRVLLAGLLIGLLAGLMVGQAQAQAPGAPIEDVKAAVAKGVAWLAAHQNADGSWGGYEQCATTALVVKKLEHHAVDPKYGLGLDSPFSDEYAYKGNVENGLAWLFANCAGTMAIGPQPAGDPDSDGDGIGVYFGPEAHHRTYTSGIALMTICEAVELDREVESGPLAGWPYLEVARDLMDYLAFGQNDGGPERGGWGYYENFVGWSDNSNSGYATLGLAYAEAASPLGCGLAVPKFVKDELNIWIDYIQNDVNGDSDDGGSGYADPNGWVNILKTGNLLQQMALVGDTVDTPRVKDALDYMARHWNDPSQDPGWRGGPGDPSSSYQGTFTAMKGFTAFGIETFGDPPVDWQADFEEELLAEQVPTAIPEEAYWTGCSWGEDVLCTTWALLTLQKAAPRIAIQVPVDIKPTSCPNPLNVKEKGVLPVAILGTADLDVTQIDPASVALAGVPPLRWSLEDVATPFEPYLGKKGKMDCTAAGPDGYLDLGLKFDAQAIVAAIGPVSDGQVLVLQLTGNLKEEFGGTAIVGEDVVWIMNKGK